MGWQLDIARIERSTKNGRPGYTDNDTFVLSMNGARQTLVKQAGGEFRVRNEGAFLRIQKQGNYWLVQDKNGTKYYFGGNWSGQNSTWPKGVAQAFSWRLSRVDDVNGNIMRYFYLNDGNGVRISHINYAPGNRVVFAYESRNDVIQNRRSVYLQRIGVRLKSVKSYAGNALAQHLELVYGQVANDPRSLLTQTIVHDPEGRLANQITQFDYSKQQINTFTGKWDKTQEYLQPVYRSTPGGTYRRRNWHVFDKKHIRYVDMVGDGKAELVYLDDAGKMTVGYGTLPNTNWVIPEAGLKNTQYCGITYNRRTYRSTYGCITPAQYNRVRPTTWKKFLKKFNTYYPRALVDMNGDGLPDWVVKTASGAWHVYLNHGRAFNSAPQTWNDPTGVLAQHLLDVNGDGLPDLFVQGRGVAYINLGNRFSTTAVAAGTSTAPYTANVVQQWNDYKTQHWSSYERFSKQLGTLIPVLTPSLWRSTPLMSAKTNLQTGLKQQINYQVQAGIANAPKLKLATVARVTTSGTVAAETRSVTYTYTGGLYAKSVKEFRGFATVTTTDEQTGNVTTTRYHQDIILQGRPKSVETRLSNGTLISRATNTWRAKQFDAGKRHFPYIYSSTQESYELDGTLVSSTTATNTYDDFGNLINSSANNGGFRTYVANTFANNASCGLVSQARTRMVSVTKTRMVSTLRWVYVSSWQRFVGSYRYRVDARWRAFVDRRIRTGPKIRRLRYVQTPQQYTTRVPQTYYVQITNPNCWILGKLTQAKVTKTTPAGDTATRTSTFAYDAKGRLASETIEPGRPGIWQTTAYGYDVYGNRTTTRVTGARIAPRTTTVAYDANGLFPASTTNALGHKETYTWDRRFGAKTSLTGPNALTTRWQYDGFGRKTAEIRADGTRTNIIYSMDIRGKTYYWKLWTKTSTTGQKPSVTYYDTYGRKRLHQTRTFDGLAVYGYTAYDALGRVAFQTLPFTSWPNHKQTNYTYDALGRVLTTTNPNGDVSSVSYAGLTTMVTNALGQTKTTVKNAIGKVVSVTDAASGTMQYTYDAFGNLATTTDAAGNVTRMYYDIRGRKTAMTDPDMGQWSYIYDTLGNLVRQTDAKGQVTTMAYDKLGRMINRTEAEGISRWTYDTRWVGALSSESSPSASKSYTYDGFGRVVSGITTIGRQSYVVGTSYDNIGRVSRITYPTGVNIQRNYNAYGYLKSVSNVATGAMIWQADTVDQFGHTTSESFGNGVVTTHVYDNLRGVQTGLQSTSGGATIQNWAYDFDAIGNMKFRTDSVVGYTESFTYDNLNRLISVRNAGNVVKKSYAYDAIGNITYKSDVGNYSYDPNHVHAVQRAGGNTYAYDANGNMTSGAGRTLQWTSFNKPSGIWTANAYTGFKYDANHNRVLKTTPTSTTAYIGKIYEQITMNGITKDVSHIYAGGKLVASIEKVAGLSPTIKYMHGDHLGSISVITDATGAVLERLRFDVFGAPVNLNGTSKASFGAAHTNRGYTGHEMDASTGLINMNARLYDPVLGRFISADTVVPEPGNMQGFNRYSYVLNNPLLYIDPTGHSWWTSFRDSFLKPVVTIAVAAAVAYFTAGLGNMIASSLGATGLAGSIVSGAVVGAAAGFAAGATGSFLYGGGLNNMLQAGFAGARMGAIAGGIAGGVSWAGGQLHVQEVVSKMAGAGLGSSANGGNMERNVQAMLYAGLGYSANKLYQAYTRHAAMWEPGKGLANGRKGLGSYDEQPNVAGNGVPGGVNVSGTNTPLEMVNGKVDYWNPANFFRQGGPVSDFVNSILPMGHAISVFHDGLQIDLQQLGGEWLRNIGNVPAMVPATVISYGALVYGGDIPVTVITDRLRQ